MSQNLVLKASGLHTNNNYLSTSTPNGSFEEAVNVVIDRSEIVEPRRGFAIYGDIDAFPTKQILSYKDAVIKHYSTKLAYDSTNTGDFLDFSGDAVTETVSGLRIKSVEMNGNLYLTSSSGVKKISATSASDFPNMNITAAGAIKAVDLNADTNFTVFGFLEPNSKAAYRIVFGKTDINENLLLGVPSARVVVWNITNYLSGQACVVDLNFSLPSGIDDTYFYQVYRTGLSREDSVDEPADPGDEMYLVIEDVITSTDVTNGYINVTDNTPESFRQNGALLYTNPVSGEGILQANEPPPFAKDIATYKNFLFYANTKSVQRLNLAFLTANGITTGTSNFQILNGTTETYTFQGTYETETVNYNAVASEAAFYNGAPASAKYFTCVSASDARKYCVWFKRNAVNDLEPSLSGYINIEVDIVSAPATADDYMNLAVAAISDTTDDFNLTLNTGTNILTVECSNNGDVSVALASNIVGMVVSRNNLGTGQDIATQKIFLPRTTGANAPSVSIALEQMAKSLVDVVNGNSAIVNAYYSSDFDQIPGQMYFENQSVTGGAFYLNSNVGSVFNPTLPVTGNAVISTNEVRPNRLYFSKNQQPEAVPLVNYLDVGPKDREIKRILGLRDSLFILKEDGIYRLSGEDASNFLVTSFDFSAQVLAPDTAVILNNQIYALSTQGVIVITDTGVSVISRPIENQILRIIREGSNYKTASFGVAYESDRSYLLFTTTALSDTVATQVFRYNTFTNTWTKWDISKTCGLVNFRDDKLYLGAADVNAIEQERKSLTRTDHADRDFPVQIQLGGIGTTAIRLNSLSNVTVGDTLIQRQYLTIAQFNRVLRKLDIDPLVSDSDYLTQLELTRGENPRTNIEELADKLDIDLSTSNYSTLVGDYTVTATAISAALQTVITIGAHDIEPNRYVTISGSNSVPSIDGNWKVISASATTITIDKRVTVAGTTASIQTDVNDSRDQQTCFNLIVNELNNDVGVFYTNYLPSSGYHDFEQSISALNPLTVSIVTTYAQDFLFGEATIYKAINSYVVYNPQFFGDPSVEKQVNQGTFMLEDTNFTLVTASFKSDKSPSLVSIPFVKGGNGDFGGFVWGTINWGGVGAPVPLRTFIPADKQRCRFLGVKFQHKVALENYALLGISLTFRPYNVRAYAK